MTDDSLPSSPDPLFGIADDEAASATIWPSGRERRLVLRVLEHWRERRGEAMFPTLRQLELQTRPHLWAHGFVLSLGPDAADPVFAAAGERLSGEAPFPLDGRRLSELPAGSLLALCTAQLDEVLAKRAPVTRGGQVPAQADAMVLYRSILLPVADDGETISDLVGAANWRKVAAR